METLSLEADPEYQRLMAERERLIAPKLTQHPFTLDLFPYYPLRVIDGTEALKCGKEPAKQAVAVVPALKAAVEPAPAEPVPEDTPSFLVGASHQIKQRAIRAVESTRGKQLCVPDATFPIFNVAGCPSIPVSQTPGIQSWLQKTFRATNLGVLKFPKNQDSLKRQDGQGALAMTQTLKDSLKELATPQTCARNLSAEFDSAIHVPSSASQGLEPQRTLIWGETRRRWPTLQQNA